MHKLMFSALVAVSVSGVLACSSSTSPATISGDSGMSDDASMTDHDSGVTTDSGVSADATGTPMTPQVSGVNKMAGALHVTWKLNDTGLSAVQLWRKKDAAAYAKLVSLPGTATSYHDTSASMAGANYCFQVMTLRGDSMSAMSAEVCGTP